jgi:hypothetical protein
MFQKTQVTVGLLQLRVLWRLYGIMESINLPKNWLTVLVIHSYKQVPIVLGPHYVSMFSIISFSFKVLDYVVANGLVMEDSYPYKGQFVSY